jgi:hypothetical protein
MQMDRTLMNGGRAYAVVGAIVEGGVAAPPDALGRRQPAGALRLEVEQRLGEGGRVVVLRRCAPWHDCQNPCHGNYQQRPPTNHRRSIFPRIKPLLQKMSCLIPSYF